MTSKQQMSEQALGTLSLRQLIQERDDIRSGEGYESISTAESEQARAEEDLQWLKTALQAAITLELATVPPYLSALWSIKDVLHPAAKSIREVVQQEMLHMALACNMLASLGVQPKISDAVPSYPGPLPGGVHDGLIVGLSGLTKPVLEKFMWIERPIEGVPIEQPYSKPGDPTDNPGGTVEQEYEGDETIGEFYTKIKEAFHSYDNDPDDPKLVVDNQISGPLAWTVIRDYNSVEYAINLIQHQGEGSKNNPEETKGNLSHYYRFLEVYNGQQYRWNEEKKALVVIGEMDFPDVWPMAEVPVGGYQQKDVSDEVWYNTDEFDNTYSRLLDELQGAWTRGGQASLIKAYATMFELEKYAKPLMQTRLPFGGGDTYGPSFRYKPEELRSK